MTQPAGWCALFLVLSAGSASATKPTGIVLGQPLADSTEAVNARFNLGLGLLYRVDTAMDHTDSVGWEF